MSPLAPNTKNKNAVYFIYIGLRIWKHFLQKSCTILEIKTVL